MTITLESLRAAFDSEDMPFKNRQLRGAYDEIERLRKEVAQCAVELEEAAKLLPLANLPRVATIYETAANRARLASAESPSS